MKNNSIPLRHAHTWTKDELWQLAALAQNRKNSWVYIAKQLKRTESACISRFNMIRLAFLLFDKRFDDAETIMDIIFKS